MNQVSLPEARIFVCVNEKAPEKTACLRGEGEKCVLWLKEEIKRRNLDKKIWVTRTRCQGYCLPEGTVVSFEPTHRQFSSVKFEELAALFESELPRLIAMT